MIGPGAAAEGVLHAFGFCGHGFQLSPLVGQLIAELAGGARRPSLDIDAFRINRFNQPAILP